jgi:hypothetical protein
LIKRLGGTTQVTSDLGRGCRFVVTIPKQTHDPQTDFMRSRVEASRHQLSHASPAVTGG